MPDWIWFVVAAGVAYAIYRRRRNRRRAQEDQMLDPSAGIVAGAAFMHHGGIHDTHAGSYGGDGMDVGGGIDGGGL